MGGGIYGRWMYPEVSWMESRELLRYEHSDSGESGVRFNDAWDEGESGRGVVSGKGVCGVKSKKLGNEGDSGDSGRGGRTCTWSLGTDSKRVS